MMGTLASVMSKGNIRTAEGLYRAEAEGDIVRSGGTIKIALIRVKYYLSCPRGQMGHARAAFDSYLQHCPAAQSVKDCIELKDELILEEAE